MADGTDWDQYRQVAGQQSANLNNMTYVLNPANMTSSPTLNTEALYAQGDTLGGISKVIAQTIRDTYGRPASADDMRAWLAQAAAEGNSADDIRTRIIKAAQTQGNASLPGASGAANAQVGPNQFGGGLMGGGNALAGGLSFSNGLMGR